MSVPERKYHSPGLNLSKVDKNPYLITTKFYVECLQNYFTTFNNKPSLEKELKREDINTVCLKELEDLRRVIPDVRYKDVVSFQNIHAAHNFYEEIDVEKRK